MHPAEACPGAARESVCVPGQSAQALSERGIDEAGKRFHEAPLRRSDCLKSCPPPKFRRRQHEGSHGAIKQRRLRMIAPTSRFAIHVRGADHLESCLRPPTGITPMSGRASAE